MELELNIGKEFSEVPLGRYKDDGEKSGEEFRESILFPKISEARASGDFVVVGLDDVKYITMGFLDEAFAGLVREHGMTMAELKKTMDIRSSKKHFDLYIENTWDYISQADDEKATAR